MDHKRLQDISEIRVGCLFPVVALVTAPFLVLGTAMAVLSVGAAIDQTASNAATRRVPATVLSAEVIEVIQAPTAGASSPGGGRGGRGAGGASSGTPEYAPLIEFEYERAGRRETSDRYNPVGHPGAKAAAEAVVQKYPPGLQVTAWLPDDPTYPAFLEKAWNPTLYAGIGAGVYAWAFCGGLLAVSGGWRWVRHAWIGAIAVSTGVLALTLWAAWHAATSLPAVPVWLTVAVGVAALSAFLPVAGAWQAGRVANALRNAGLDGSASVPAS